MANKTRRRTLPLEVRVALRKMATVNGRRWKKILREIWECNCLCVADEHDRALLRRAQDILGYDGLDNLRL